LVNWKNVPLLDNKAMKKLRFPILLLLLVICVRIHSDVLYSKPIQPAQICASVQNLSNYPNIALIGFTEGFALSKPNVVFNIKSGSYFMIQIYNPITLYAVKMEYLEKMGIHGIDWKNDKNVMKSNLTISAKSFKVKPLIYMVKLDYRIAGFTDSTIVLYKYAQTSCFSNGKPDLIQKYEFTRALPKLHQNVQ